MVELDPSRSQEYKWRELEEQRQAQKLQRQLQQEQAYLLSLQKNQSLDGTKTPPRRSSSLPRALDREGEKPPQSLEPQGCDVTRVGSGQSQGPENPAESPGPAPEPVREVTPPLAPPPAQTVERFLCLCVPALTASGVPCLRSDGWDAAKAALVHVGLEPPLRGRGGR